MRRILGGLLGAVALLLMLVGLVFHAAFSVLRGILYFDRQWQFHVYYRVVQLKRWVTQQPLWQEYDLKINIMPPKGHPLWEKWQSNAEIVGISMPRRDDD